MLYIHHQAWSTTYNHARCCYVVVVSYYWIKNRSSRPISDSFAWPSPYEVVYRPHPILIATCRQVSGCPSSRRTVWGRGSPRVTPRWEGRGSRAPVPLLSDHTEPVLHAFLWEQSICQNEQILFFFFNQNNAKLLHYCPSAKHKEMGDFSVYYRT